MGNRCMNAMLIVAHGSRLPSSNDEIHELTDKVAQRISDSQESDFFELVDCAFLELTDPSIEIGIDSLIKRGAQRIQVVPYFLARGKHVARDIPEIINAVREKNPGVEILITDYLGKSDMMPDVLLSVLTN